MRGPADSSNPGGEAAEFTVYRLARWAVNAPDGIAYVAYDSPDERTAVEARILREVQTKGLTVERLDLSAATTVADAIATLTKKIRETKADLLSVSGFTGFLRTLGDDWTPFNYRREEWFDTPIRQIWWVPSVYDAVFARRAPDLYAWFLVRERLTGPARPVPLTPTPRAPGGFDLDAARRRSEAAKARFNRAYSEKASLAVLVKLVESAVRPLFEADANEEARELFDRLLSRLEKGQRKNAWAVANDDPATLETKSDLAHFCAQNAEYLLVDRLLQGVTAEQIERIPFVDQADLYLAKGIAAAYHGAKQDAANSLGEALKRYEIEEDELGRAHALWSLGDLALQSGEWHRARSHYEAALPLYETRSNLLGYSTILVRLGDVAQHTGDYEESRRLYEMAKVSYGRLGYRQGLANVEDNVGQSHLVRGELSLAKAAFDRAKTIYSDLGDELGYANALSGIGEVFLHRADSENAIAAFSEAFTVYQSIEDPHGEANTLISLGDLDVIKGDTSSAAEKYDRAKCIYQSINHPSGHVSVLRRLGSMHLSMNDTESAAPFVKEAYRLSRNSGGPLERGNASFDLAVLRVSQRERQVAQLLCDEALHEYRAVGNGEMIGRVHGYQATISEGEERAKHIQAARDAWTRAGREDLLPSLDDL